MKYHKMLKDIIKAKKDYDAKKLTKQEVNKVRREAREFIRLVMNVLDMKRAKRLSVSKVQFKYGKGKVGELVLLEKVAFLVKDVTKRDSVMIASLTKDGLLQNLKKSSVDEYEKYIKSMKLPHSRLVKPQMFEGVKDAVGEDVEIIWKG